MREGGENGGKNVVINEKLSELKGRGERKKREKGRGEWKGKEKK